MLVTNLIQLRVLHDNNFILVHYTQLILLVWSTILPQFRVYHNIASILVCYTNLLSPLSNFGVYHEFAWRLRSFFGCITRKYCHVCWTLVYITDLLHYFGVLHRFFYNIWVCYTNIASLFGVYHRFVHLFWCITRIYYYVSCTR